MKLRKRGIEAIKERYGYLFVIPWIFGIVVFVIKPMIMSIAYAFSRVKITGTGVSTEFIGLKNIKDLLFEDESFLTLAFSSLADMLKFLPIIISLSMILAIVLNQNFKGRTLARSVFFLPVIINSGPVMAVLASFAMGSDLSSSFGAADSPVAAYMQVIDFQELLVRLNLPESVNTLMTGYLSDLFNLIWSCGIQILLFVAGLQTIPAQLYEVSKVEGATVWEEFWYITIPMLGRTILLVSFYTMVDLFVEKSSLVTSAIALMKKQSYAVCSAMLWLYFILVGVCMAIVIFLYKKICLDKWES